MIGRGDMGVEIPYEELPAIQKKIIRTCRIYGKRVITATEMLESMINNPRPTRAEISDVANAVYDGSSAIMLSGETASGKYPVQTVSAMSRIALEAEQQLSYTNSIKENEYIIHTLGESISSAASVLAQSIKASAIVVCTLTGKTARMVSRFRPHIDIIAMTTDEKAYRKLAMSWGVTPVMSEVYGSTDVLFYFAKTAAKQSLGLKKGDKIVITGGAANDVRGTSLIKVEEI
jgi:pyruvate kinase